MTVQTARTKQVSRRVSFCFTGPFSVSSGIERVVYSTEESSLFFILLFYLSGKMKLDLAYFSAFHRLFKYWRRAIKRLALGPYRFLSLFPFNCHKLIPFIKKEIFRSADGNLYYTRDDCFMGACSYFY